MGSFTWFIAMTLSLIVGFGGAAPNAFALPLVDDVVETVDDTADYQGEEENPGDDDSGLLESVTDDVVDPVEQVVDPVVDDVVDPIVEIIEDADDLEDVDDVVDVIDAEPDDGTTLPVAGTEGPSTPSERGSSAPTPQDLETTPDPSAVVIATLEASEQQTGSVVSTTAFEQSADETLSDDRLASMLLSRSQPSTLGTALQPLDGVMAWLTNGPTIARLLAAPLALLNLLIRALLSAGSGLVAPLSLTAAIVVRQLQQGRRRAPVC